MIPPTIYAQKRRGEVGHAQLQVHCRYLKPPTGIDSDQKKPLLYPLVPILDASSPFNPNCDG